MLRCRQQVRRVIGTQHFGWMRIECDDYRCAARGFGVSRGSGNDGLMTEMHAVEGADGEEERPGKLAQFRNRAQDSHHALVRRRASATLPAALEFARGFRLVPTSLARPQ